MKNLKSCLETTFEDANSIQLNSRTLMHDRSSAQKFYILLLIYFAPTVIFFSLVEISQAWKFLEHIQKGTHTKHKKTKFA